MVSSYVWCFFIPLSMASARLSGVNSLNTSMVAEARRLYQYSWHEAYINVLQSPAKHTGYQYFGNAISSDDSLVIIGAPGDNVMTFLGSVSIFETKSFELVDYLVSDYPEQGDQFGGAVAISGWDALIGAHRADSQDGDGDMGQVYYYSSRDGMTWSVQQRIRASNLNSYDYFGSSVALYHKNKAVIGAWGSDFAAGGGGAVYTYRMVNGRWAANGMLISPAPTDFEWFGASVSVYGHILAVGAAGSTHGGNMGGAVYVFSDDNDTGKFKNVKKIYGEASDNCGKSVAVHGDLLVVGSPGAYRYKADYYDQFASRTGRVAVYRQKDGVFVQEEAITCGDCANGDSFGSSVGVNGHGGTIVVGKKRGAFVYQYDGSAVSGFKWKDETELIPPAETVSQGNSYGLTVAVSTTTAFVGSRDETGLGGTQAGVVFGFEGAKDPHNYALEAQYRKEIMIYEVLYSIIGLGLVILIILPIIMIGQVLADKMKDEVDASASAKDQKPLIK